MIVIPCIAELRGGSRVYLDSDDAGLAYVDKLQPGAATEDGTLLRVAEFDGRNYLNGEVCFGPDESRLKETARHMTGKRLLTVPWEPGRVNVWTTDADGHVQRLANGVTSGYGRHNTVFSAELGEAEAPLQVAVALHCRARLQGARVIASGLDSTAAQVAAALPVGVHAPWTATLAEVTVAVLRELVKRRMLSLMVEARDLALPGLDDLRELALHEWATRLLADCGHGEALAHPAATLSELSPRGDSAIDFVWQPGDTVNMRTVRSLHMAPGKHSAGSRHPSGARGLKVRGKGDWHSFDYVEVMLSAGDAGIRLMLTPQTTEVCWDEAPTGLEGLQVTARAAVRGTGVLVDLPAPRLAAGMLHVELPAVRERSLLVQADRELLRATGPLAVQLEHPALAASLCDAAAGVLVLSPEQGDLAKVSVPYRALSWADGADAPFRVHLIQAEGRSLQWQDVAADGVIHIRPGHPPILYVAADDKTNSVECAQGHDLGVLHSLGRRPAGPGRLAAFAHAAEAGPLWLRSCYPADSGHYCTPWQEVCSDGTPMAPSARLQTLAVLALDRSAPCWEVEVAPTRGSGGECRATVRPGRATSLHIWQSSGLEVFRYRVRALGPNVPGKWSAWDETQGPVLQLNPYRGKGKQAC